MGDGQRILVVDDELGPREALRMMLKSKYQVLTAATGADALQVVRHTPPGLVLLDIKMREMSGIEVLRQIKEIDANIEVIMITAYASLQTAREAMAYGASEYLIKPFSKKEVEEAIKKALARRAKRTGRQQDVHTLLDQLRSLAHTSSTAAAPEVLARTTSVLSQVQRLLGAAATVLYLRDTPTAAFRCELMLPPPSAMRHALAAPVWTALLSQVLTADRPLVLQRDTEVSAGLALPPSLADLGYTSGLLCPMRITAEVEGVLAFFATAPDLMRVDETALGQMVADLLAMALHTQITAAQHGQRVAQLSILREISQVILGQMELSDTLQAIGKQLQEGLGYAGFYVWLPTPPDQQLRQAYGIGPNLGWQPDHATPTPECLQVLDAPNGQVVLAPIVVAGMPIGVLKIVRDTHHGAITPVELDLLRMLLDSIALAVHNSSLYGEIAATKSFLENLIQGAGDAILTIDLSNRITSCNGAGERFFQVSTAEILQQPIGVLLPDDQYRQWRASVEECGHSLQVDACLTLQQGSQRDVVLTLSPLRGRCDTMVGLSLILKDMTENRQLREQVLQTEKLRAIGEMAAGIAHNFNNVLTTILTRAQLLAQQLSDGVAVQRGLTLIEQAAADGATIVRRLQKLTRGAAPSEAQWLDLNDLVTEVIETTQPLWQDHTRCAHGPLKVSLDLDPLPRILGRPAELREVLTNLLLNAIEAMPKGGELTLRTWVEGRWVHMSVTDTGVGMSVEVQRRLFDPFFTTKGTRGMGLGLSISQALIKGHHGTLNVHSEPGWGTTFVITLPYPSATAMSPDDPCGR